MILLPLPVVIAIGAIVYASIAWRTRTPRLWRNRILCTLWLAVGSAILFLARERVRNWADFDNAFAATLFISFAGVAVLLGALLALFALIGRSTHGAGLCPRCWYDMTGTSESDDATCPECGLAVRAQSDLVHRKRWPVLVAVAIVIQLAGQFSYQIIRADNSGANAFVPTTALVAAMYSLPRESIIGSGSHFDTDTLTGRLRGAGSSDWQKQWALGKAIDGLSPGASRETAFRAGTILNRSQYAGEIPFANWQASMQVLCASGDNVAESLTYLTDSYLRSRLTPAAARFSPPIDPALSQKELASLVPDLLEMVRTKRTRSTEWWDAVQLLAIAGPDAEPVVALLERRILVDESDSSRSANAFALANLAGRFQSAPAAFAAALESLDENERVRLLFGLSRQAPDHPDLDECFRVLLASGEPALENIGALGIATAPATRCEGVRLLVQNFERHSRHSLAPADVSVFLGLIARDPTDGASDEIISYLENLLLYATPERRNEILNAFNSIGRVSEDRNRQLVAFLTLLTHDQDPEFADRVRLLLKDLNSTTAYETTRPFATIIPHDPAARKSLPSAHSLTP